MIKFKIYLNFFIISLLLKIIKTSDNSSGSNSIKTTRILVDSDSNQSYSDNLCGNIEGVPCTSIGDAGDRARTLLEKDYSNNGINNNELIIELLNQVYLITDENSNCTFGNLFGFNSIIINNGIINGSNIIGSSGVDSSSSDDYYSSSSSAGGNSDENGIITIDGINHSNSSLAFLVIEPIEKYKIDSMYFEINNIKFENFSQDIIIFDFKINSTTTPDSSSSSSSLEKTISPFTQISYLNVFQFYNTHFNNINGTIVKSNPWTIENDENNNSSDYSNENSSSINDLLSNIVFISSSFNSITTTEIQPTIQIFGSKLQLLLCSIKNSMILNNSMVYIDRGALKMYASVISKNLGNGFIQSDLLPIPMITMLDSGVNMQIEDSIVENNENLNCFFLCNQTLTPVANYQLDYEYVFFDDLTVCNNVFDTNLNPTLDELGFISILSNINDIGFQKSFTGITFQNNSRSVINSIPLFYLENGRFLLNSAQFRDKNFYNFQLINTNVSLTDNIIASHTPFLGENSQISYDTLSLLPECSNFAICSNCMFNGKYYPDDTCSSNSNSVDSNQSNKSNYVAILVSIAAIVVVVGIVATIAYNFYVKTRIRVYFDKRSQLKNHSLDEVSTVADENSFLLYNHQDTNHADTDQVGGYDDESSDYNDGLNIQVAGNVINNY